jgi:hypothetical protein
LPAAVWNSHTSLQVKKNGGHRISSVEENFDGSTDGISVSEIMDLYNISTIDILKIDIEGSEKNIFQSNYER